ncbi:MAG: deaminase [Dehalococcoidales bacterium]|jgi:dCMP deaminase
MQDSLGQTTQTDETSSFSSVILSEEPYLPAETSEWYNFVQGIPEHTKSLQTEKYLSDAYEFARRRSEDPRTQVGATIVGSGGQSFGTNRMPGFLHLIPERLRSDTKADFLIHAERDAICSAAKHGIKTGGGKIFAPWACCAQCAHAIISAGLKELVVHTSIMLQTPERWQQSVQLGLSLCMEAGVIVLRYTGQLDCAILFNGEEARF